MEPSLEIHTPVTNGGAIDWYRSILSNGKISEEKIKTEAGKFFNLSFEDKAKDKKMFKIRLEGLLKSQKNMETNLVREILKAKGGQGKHCEIPQETSSVMLIVRKKGDCHFLNQQEMK